MKLTIIGGGGARAPYLAKIVAKKLPAAGIRTVVFQDIEPQRLRIFGGMAKEIVRRIAPELNVVLTLDAVEAVQDADFVITTIRPGFERARAQDERAALKQGVLGQETTGPGGFAMALRSIPAILEYCKLVKKHAKPQCLVFNFTNPSGLVTQYMRNEGFDNVYGVCDGPGGLMNELDKEFGLKPDETSAEWFGLNHLSWLRSVRHNGVEKIDELVNSEKLFSNTECRLFDPELVKRLGMLPNEYLFFYYHREKALEGIAKNGKTRGETIAEINAQLIEKLATIDTENDFDKALEIYLTALNSRSLSYFSIESQGKGKREGKELSNDAQMFLQSEADAGYVGIVMEFIKARTGGSAREILLNVPNNGAIEGMADNDVVEVTCTVEAGAVTPKRIGKAPQLQLNLMKQVKLYERLTVEAIKTRSIQTAIDALWAHPLVNSYSIAKNLVHHFVREYGNCSNGEWK